MDSHIYNRERGRNVCTELFMLVEIDMLFALELSGNYFSNAHNCFKAALSLIHGESNNCTGGTKHQGAAQN